jgi:hypothetical protein
VRLEESSDMVLSGLEQNNRQTNHDGNGN